MGRLGLPLGAALLFAGIVLIARGRLARIAVSGHSMEPALRDGDWLIVDRSARTPRVGHVLVAHDPRARERLIVKRVGEVGAHDQIVLISDHPAHADDRIGPVRPADVVGRAVLRYWPPARGGRIV